MSVIRCAVCRETTEVGDAYKSHLRRHSIWSLMEVTWRIDRPWTIAMLITVGILALTVVAFALVWLDHVINAS